ncbi:Zinc finger protein 64-like 2 [Homarus americanus]|uniref:Zinc finger protein 64-like 2 n=1 Tax=Homarus americanus TaxID=6706 RepID=A0A8J5K3N0_HOMAM|nr:Zinc finger protein 64-like 2 [Homarus americanus]
MVGCSSSNTTFAKLNQCLYCLYSTPIITNLKNHMLTHTDEKPFACTWCPYRCKQKGNLKRHIVTNHSAEMLMLSKTGNEYGARDLSDPSAIILPRNQYMDELR